METSNNNIKYAYLHEGKRHVTIAKKIDRENGKLFFSFAVCCPRDNFSKKIGRVIAGNRLEIGTRDWENLTPKAVCLELKEGTPTNALVFQWLAEKSPVESIKKMARAALRTKPEMCLVEAVLC
jgi:hypothetical protein